MEVGMEVEMEKEGKGREKGSPHFFVQVYPPDLDHCSEYSYMKVDGRELNPRRLDCRPTP